MSYKKDLEEAKTYEDCQNAYDKECERKFRRLEKEHGNSYAFTKMIAQDYSVWVKAQNRLEELYPDLANSYDPDDRIKSRY